MVKRETIAVNSSQATALHTAVKRHIKMTKSKRRRSVGDYFRRIPGKVPAMTTNGTHCANHRLVEVQVAIRRRVIKHKSRGRVVVGGKGGSRRRSVACYARRGGFSLTIPKEDEEIEPDEEFDMVPIPGKLPKHWPAHLLKDKGKGTNQSTRTKNIWGNQEHRKTVKKEGDDRIRASLNPFKTDYTKGQVGRLSGLSKI